jgi:hypothetical protein
MNNEFKFEVKEGIQELVIRQGEAEKIHEKENVKIAGAIDAVSRFIEKRNHNFKNDESFTMVKRDEKTIECRINEQLANGYYMIKGEIKLSKDYLSLGLNNPEVSYSPVQLSQKLKMMRSFFPNKSEYNMIVSTLRNLKASISKKVEDLNDQRGNTTKLFEQTVESNMPEQFELELALIKGEPNFKFFVSIILEADGSDINCFLESIDANDIIDVISSRRIDEEIEKIKDYTTIIEA